MQVERVERRAVLQARLGEAAVVLHFITTNEQPVVRHADSLHRLRADQRTVEQAGVLGQKLAFKLCYTTMPRRPLTQRKRQLARIFNIGNHRADLGQLVLGCLGVQRFQRVVACRAAVIVGAPNRVRTQRQRVQETVGEPTRATQVGFGRQVHRLLPGQAGQQLFHSGIFGAVFGTVFSTVVHHDHPIHRVRLVHHLLQRMLQQVNTFVGDNDRGRRAVWV